MITSKLNNPQSKPPFPIRAVEWIGAQLTGRPDYEIDPYFHSASFLVDFAATFFIYGKGLKWRGWFWF